MKGINLEENQLINYLEKLAIDQNIIKKSKKETFPQKRLEENYQYIVETYNLLNEHIKKGIVIHSAGEWLLDNMYIIEETYKVIKTNLKLKDYTRLPGIANGIYKGYARIYVIAIEIISGTDSIISVDNLEKYIKAYQRKSSLLMEEIWNIGLFLQIAIIEKIREVCEKIKLAQEQKYRAELILSETICKNEFKYPQKYKTKIESKENYFNMKYPFIEYMVFRIKQYGKKSGLYLSILDEIVNKMGTTLDEVIKKEHFDIAIKKVTMGNCIKSINTIKRIDFEKLFEEINGIEEILRKDPANIYTKMDYKTKEAYREKIKEISNSTGLAEKYIANKLIKLADKKRNLKERHIGYYLIRDGQKEFYSILTNKKRKYKDRKIKEKEYVITIVLITLIILFFIANILKRYLSILENILYIIIFSIPIYTVVTKIIQYILQKNIKPKIIPKINLNYKIEKENSTMVVIPVMLNSREKVKKILEKLEIFYLGNKSENLYFCLLGDTTSEKIEKVSRDKDIINEIKSILFDLNTKYMNIEFPIFNAIYRNRTWNDSENCFMGWERKRGMLEQFNLFLLNKKDNKNEFRYNSMQDSIKEGKQLPKIKYVITLDEDTNLILDSVFELVGAMEHILNKPEINKDNIVENGYGIIQPRISTDLFESSKNKFTKLFDQDSGIDTYSNLISNIYQDCFEEGIYVGKGIYNLEVFNEVLNNRFKDNTILSHDLIEGLYTRCATCTDIVMLDGIPSNYISNRKRNHRWVRGDFQILDWIEKTVLNRNDELVKNNLSFFSKFKILDNCIREIKPIFELLLIVLFFVFKNIYPFEKFTKIFGIIVLILIFQNTIIYYIDRLIYKKNNEKKYKTYNNKISKGLKVFIKDIIDLGLLPDTVLNNFDAMIRVSYRKCISNKKLLEWKTSSEVEKSITKSDSVIYYYKIMILNIFLGISTLVLSFLFNNMLLKIEMFLIGILWLCTPYIMNELSKVNKKEKIIYKDKELKKELEELAQRTWRYFEDTIIEENNYLVPDNYQEDRKEKFVKRTSSTNIGLGILAVISAYNMNFIDIKTAIEMIKNIINTIIKLQKWNGHLYNWYDVKTLEPLYPRYISTVDSGNFIGYLLTCKGFLEDLLENKSNEVEKYSVDIMIIIDIIQKIVQDTDFSTLFDKEKNIFSIGFNLEENKKTDSYYDLLASEARQASLIAIAKRDVPRKHWNSLSRTLTVLNGYNGLVSWSGTAFEYLMPDINIPTYEGSLLGETSYFLVMSQIEYGKKMGTVWGISESAFNLKDLNNNYQYKAFGIPWLGLKRGLINEKVISPYSSIMAINLRDKEVIENINKLKEMNMYNKYGLYESIDFTYSRLNKGEKYKQVETYMAHHQGLILASINNYINEDILKKYFMKNKLMNTILPLLQEKIPNNVIITKEKKEKIEKIKYKDYEDYLIREIKNKTLGIPEVNVISNGEYINFVNENGENYSKYNDICIFRYKRTDEISNGLVFYFKNIQSKKIWTSIEDREYNKQEKDFTIKLMPDRNELIRIDGNIETRIITSIVPNKNIEIRNIELNNLSTNNENIELYCYLEPILSKQTDDYAHKLFNNLFLEYELLDNNIILVTRNKKSKIQDNIYLAIQLFDENNFGFEFEIDKEKFLGRNNEDIPEKIIESNPLENKIKAVVNGCIAIKKNIFLKNNQSISISLLMSVGKDREEVVKELKSINSNQLIEREIKLGKVKSETENRYLNVNSEEINNSQKILKYLLQNRKKSNNKEGNINVTKSINQIWKYGISGDYPIIIVEIKSINEIEILLEILKIFEYIRSKNLKINIVIINEEKQSYDPFVKNGIEEIITNMNMWYLVNNEIFIIDNKKEDEIREIEYWGDLIFESNKGNLTSQIEEIEYGTKNDYFNELKEKNKVINGSELEKLKQNKRYLIDTNINHNELIEQTNKLKYYNEYGGFDTDDKIYSIYNLNLPEPWSYVMANERFGTIVTEKLGGYTWFENSRLNRLTAWSNDIVKDSKSEELILKYKDKIWNFNDNIQKVNYGYGVARYYQEINKLKQELEIFIPNEYNVKVLKLKIDYKENDLRENNFELIYKIKLVLGEDEIKTTKHLNVEYEKENNILYIRNIANEEISYYSYVSSNKKIKNYYLDEKGVLFIKFEISDNNIFLLGANKSKENIVNDVKKLINDDIIKEELEKVKNKWNKILNKIQVKTPMESFDILMNSWLIYQSYACRVLAKTSIYQSGGANGFRDQLQDTLGLKYINIELMKKQIIKCCMHQFETGDVQHWWHELNNRGVKTRFSDDLLWLPYMVYEYIEYTNDYKILNEQVSYLLSEELKENENDKYDIFEKTKYTENVYEHCKKAIERALDFGENNLPKIGSGDWNDGFSELGIEGKGESVWLGFFLYDVLGRFMNIVKYKNEKELEAKYEEIRKQLKKNLNNEGWDGRWFRRAFDDQGRILGSNVNEECKIDGISQAWSIISNAAENDKKYIAMDNYEKMLIDKENEIIKLFAPPIKKSEFEPGYVKGYVSGTRENGGQYTHGAIWGIKAYCLLGFGDKAVEFFRMINPIEHARTKQMANKYQVEPYVVAADVYSKNELIGKGGWTWYTGSSSWMYEIGLKYILGIIIKENTIEFNPCISSKWKEYEVIYNYKDTQYKIKVCNQNEKQTGVEEVKLDGKIVKNKIINVTNDRKIHHIELKM